MRIGFVQLAPVLGNRQTTIARLDRLFASVGAADLLVLPELCNSGYHFSSRQQAWETSEEISDSVFVRYLESVCAARNLYLVSGLNERDGGDLYNSAVLVGPRGYVGRYRKLHLFMDEKDYFRPGDGLPVLDIGACRVGMLVCFDWIFPEAWRILALKGADVVCHPANLVLPFAQRAVPVHALTNRFYTVTANRVGQEGDLVFTGCSTIADIQGNVLLQASESEERVGVVDVDVALARDKRITPRNDVLRDRRTDQYELLLRG